VENNLLEGKIFDWGCGYGYDLDYFRSKGFITEGWDPVHRPDTPPDKYIPGSFNWVHCASVLNTLPNPDERLKILLDIYNFLPPLGNLSLTVRSQGELNSRIKPTWIKYSDGWITAKETFQKGYLPKELVEIIAPLFKEIIVIAKTPLFVIARRR